MNIKIPKSISRIKTNFDKLNITEVNVSSNHPLDVNQRVIDQVDQMKYLKRIMSEIGVAKKDNKQENKTKNVSEQLTPVWLSNQKWRKIKSWKVTKAKIKANKSFY